MEWLPFLAVFFTGVTAQSTIIVWETTTAGVPSPIQTTVILNGTGPTGPTPIPIPSTTTTTSSSNLDWLTDDPPPIPPAYTTTRMPQIVDVAPAEAFSNTPAPTPGSTLVILNTPGAPTPSLQARQQAPAITTPRAMLGREVNVVLPIDDVHPRSCTSYNDPDQRKICECTAQYKQPMWVTGWMPYAFQEIVVNQTMGILNTTNAHTSTGMAQSLITTHMVSHWGITDDKQTQLFSAFGHVAAQPTYTTKGDNYPTTKVCTGRHDCYKHCWAQHTKKTEKHHRAAKIGAIVGGVLGALLMGLLGCACCFLCLPRIRNRRRRNERPSTVVDPVPTTVPEIREVPPTAVAPSTAAAEPAPVEPVNNNSKGTLTRQAEEGRARPSVQFEDAPKVAEEKPIAAADTGAEHVEKVPETTEKGLVKPAEEVVHPVEAVHDGAASVTGIASNTNGYSSLRGRRLTRAEGL